MDGRHNVHYRNHFPALSDIRISGHQISRLSRLWSFYRCLTSWFVTNRADCTREPIPMEKSGYSGWFGRKHGPPGRVISTLDSSCPRPRPLHSLGTSAGGQILLCRRSLATTATCRDLESWHPSPALYLQWWRPPQIVRLPSGNTTKNSALRCGAVQDGGRVFALPRC